MRTRTRELGLLLSMAVGVAMMTGCNSTTVTEKEPVAPAAVLVTNVPAPSDTNAPSVAANDAGGTPVQKSLRPHVNLPEEVSKVVQLVESGAGEEVVRAYVNASSARYELSLEQIVYLRDIGVNDTVIAAMMRRGSELRDKDAETAAMQTNLVAAVEQIKEGLAGGMGTNNEGAPAAVPAGESAAPPAPAAGPAPAPAPAVAVQAVQAPAEAPAPVQQFYTSLSPYGTWYQVPTYGWVWQPSVVVVDRTWMPYRHGGRWMWTDCGWYWYSDYTWGWAPFHYGRWALHPGLGWCWAPDTVWGPSWVTWRHCDGYIGWAPLPPACGWSHGVGLTWYGSGISVGFSFGLTPHCYTFVPGRRFGHRNISHHAVRGHEHDGAFQKSTVVNNVINGNNNVIVNNGIGYNQVAALTRDEIPKARVQPLPAEANTTLRADRLERSRDGAVVYRPTEVANVGGRPTLRSEVRPVSASSGFAAPTAGGVPTRATSSPRFSGASGAAGVPSKAVETRGNARPAAPVAGSRSPGVSGAPSASPNRPYSGTPSVRSGEGRGGAVVNQPAPVGGASTPTVGPRRETAPVPLSNPNRFLPRASTPSGPASQPSRSGSEARGVGSGASSVAPAATPQPAARPAPAVRPSYQAPVAPLRNPASAPSSSSLPTSGGRSTVATPAPVLSAPPRPTYSAPAVSAPARPAYSPPTPSSAPVMSAPRPTVSMPAPVAAPRPAPSAPAAAPNANGSGRNGPRTQPN